MSNPDFGEQARVQESVMLALRQLVSEDHLLLEISSSERSLTHRLAVHLGKQFRGYDIDCEYNRDGINGLPKSLVGISNTHKVRADDLRAVTVFPDIIVHKRTKNDRNLLVLEVKKDNGSRQTARDKELAEWDNTKLLAYKSQFGYKVALFLTIPVGHGFRSRESSIVSV